MFLVVEKDKSNEIVMNVSSATFNYLYPLWVYKQFSLSVRVIWVHITTPFHPVRTHSGMSTQKKEEEVAKNS